MARIIKNYEERKGEILDTAQQLFFQKGYDHTSVNDIITSIGIAKGTFYHYFESKEDLLDKLVSRWIHEVLPRVKKLAKRKDLNDIEKLNQYFITIRIIKVENIELMKILMRVLYKDENLLLRYKIFKKQVDLLTPEFAKVIRQGMDEGSMDPVDDEETAQLIFSLSVSLNEITVKMLLEADVKTDNIIDKIEKKLKVYERVLERIVGAEKGSVSVVERKFIEIFMKNKETDV